MRRLNTERGAVALFALGVLAVISILAGSWLRLVSTRVHAAAMDGLEAQARLLADAGVERVLAWFADPMRLDEAFELGAGGACRPPSEPADVFRKRCVGDDGLPSYVDPAGMSQFSGTPDSPGVRLHWREAESLLIPPQGIDRPLDSASIPVRVEVRVFAPTTPDALASVVSIGTVGRAFAAVRAELVNGPWRGVAHPVIAREWGANTIPVRVHWGAVAVDGSVDLTALLDRVPRRESLASITGMSYATEPGSDRWIGLLASGMIVGPAREVGGFTPPFGHFREGVPPPRGLWGHEALRAYALRHAVYFSTRGTGLLYPADGGPGLTPARALAAISGTGRFVFVDTLDGLPPHDDNLDTLDVDVDYVEAVTYFGAHVRFNPGTGHSVTLDTPTPLDRPDGSSAATGITIGDVHYRGALVVAGDLSSRGRMNLVGTVTALRGVQDAGALEVWYDASLRMGYLPGFSPVLIRAGTRRAIALDSP